MDALLWLQLLALPAGALTALGVPPILMGMRSRWLRGPVLAWILAIIMTVAWLVDGYFRGVASDESASGGMSIFDGSAWLVMALILAVLSISLLAMPTKHPDTMKIKM